MLLYIKEQLKWAFAEKELIELERWRNKQAMYRAWLSEFKDVSIVLDNLRTEVEGQSSLDNSHPAGKEGPWTIESLRYILKNKTYLNNKTPIPENI